MVNILLDFLSKIKPISSELSTHLQSIITIAEKPKGTKLLFEGQTNDKLIFIVKGLARSYYYQNETQVTSWIVAENDFIFSPASFILQKPSIETIELLENTSYLIINKSDFEVVYDLFPEMIYIALRMNQKYMLIFEEWAKILRMSAEERFTEFELKYPKINGRVKIEYLATYLGISRSSIQSMKSKTYNFQKIKPFQLEKSQMKHSDSQ